MPFQIAITQQAKSQLRGFQAREQRVIEVGIKTHLCDRPAEPSHAIKTLRPNPFATHELRLGDFRVLYNVDNDDSKVVILLVGRKVGNALIVEGKEFRGHQSDPTE
jgi:mRNA-degrading endonuclease RelE of RelBE toxin-antitoxin system